MKIIHALIGYLFYFFAPKTLVRQSFNGTLLQLGVRLPSQAIDEISINIFDTYQKNKEIDKIMNRGGMTENMERIAALVQYEAFYIKDLISPQFSLIHEKRLKTIEILKKYNVVMPNLRT